MIQTYEKTQEFPIIMENVFSAQEIYNKNLIWTNLEGQKRIKRSFQSKHLTQTNKKSHFGSKL